MNADTLLLSLILDCLAQQKVIMTQLAELQVSPDAPDRPTKVNQLLNAYFSDALMVKQDLATTLDIHFGDLPPDITELLGPK